MHHPTDRIAHTTAFVTPVVEHWLEREIAQRVPSVISLYCCIEWSALALIHINIVMCFVGFLVNLNVLIYRLYIYH